MGTCQSKNAVPDSASVSSLTRKSKGSSNVRNGSPNPPQTRARLDSWANPPTAVPDNVAQTLNQNNEKRSQGNSQTPPQHTSLSMLESQWKRLWETHSPHLVDPVDVPSVLDMLLDKTINRLSAVQITWLQRKVRATFAVLPNSGGSVLAKIVSNQNGQVASDAKLMADKMRLLHPSIWMRVLPVAAWCPSFHTLHKPTPPPRRNSSNQNLNLSASNLNAPNLATLNGSSDSDSYVWNDLVLRNLELILLHLSNSDWERVTLAAGHAAEAARLEMDVNKRDKGWVMPRPSVVPEITDPAVPPPGVTFQALAAIIALAIEGTRSQRLHLLFYLLLSDLPEFLTLHPAGGAPVWLLETGNNTVISLASLIHYHYFGNAFLPVQPTAKTRRKHNFVASQSRRPLKIAVKNLHTFLLDIVEKPSEKSSRAEQEPALSDVESAFPPKLQDRMNVMVPDMYTEDVLKSCATLKKSIASYSADSEAKPHFTIQEFDEWLEHSVDDALLELVMHRLFAAGVLSSHADEARWVASEWALWNHRQQSLASEIYGSNHDAMIDETPAIEAQRSLSRTQSQAPFDDFYSQIWGGIGGIDGGGGTGHGILYCIDQDWWNTWCAYVAWSWVGERPVRRTRLGRPRSLSNSRLVEKTDGDGVYIAGALGSYEMMKNLLQINEDYILVPPGVWNVLYELYGGGPPLPRAIRLLSAKEMDTSRYVGGKKERKEAIHNGNGHEHGGSLGRSGSDRVHRVPRLPDWISVASHPWVVNVQLCDPAQPYRRGDVGLASIRVMVTPEEPLWRLLAEAVRRFTFDSFKAFGVDGRGRARLWKRANVMELKTPMSRYGPWNLLCKNRYATIPNLAVLESNIDHPNMDWFVNDWRIYTDDSTVESGGVVNHDRLILEFAVQSKDVELIWPREAAAKAGHARRLVEEEIEFRRMLQGFDVDGNPMIRPPDLVGLKVDAMDSTGRWYPVTVLAVDIIDEDTSDEENQFASRDEDLRVASKRVKVDFSEHGGHIDWIDVESDRLGPAGRFTNETDQQALSKPNGASSVSAEKTKSAIVTKKTNSNISEGGETAKLCSLPGFGACGLTNLGNTCYMNSALQCISYMPLLRAYLLSNMFKATGDLNRDNPLGTGGKFLEESAELMKIMWCSRFGEKSPIRFKAHLGKFNPQFSGADQQDAQEFLNYMLDVLHEDSNRVRKKPYVEALSDDYVRQHQLNRVGEESWRRFLRRNRSVVSDVAMGQVLNTVTCPACNYSSRNFDPFNLLSIPIPTIADVIFQCTFYRRATPATCPWVLNRSRRESSSSTRYSFRAGPRKGSGPPLETYVAEQYAITMSRLADSGDLRLQLQNLCGIASARLHLFRLEEVENDGFQPESVLSHRASLIPLNDKEGPCSQLMKKRGQNDASAASVTPIIAFESSLRPRQWTDKPELSGDSTLNENTATANAAHSDHFLRCLDSYGDDAECRVYDSDPLVLVKEASRRMWPESAQDFTIGLRVDAKDQRGNWFSGSVVKVFDDATCNEGNESCDEVVKDTRRVSVHFDNFSSKWDETYSIRDFQEGNIQSLFSHATPKTKPTDLLVYHRYDNTSVYFGLPFYASCRNEWTNARAGAQILAQVSRFLYYPPVDPEERKGPQTSADPFVERALHESRYYDKIQRTVSELIDILLEYDRKYVRLGLGLTTDDTETVKLTKLTIPLEQLVSELELKVADYLALLPFEIRISSMDPVNADKTQGSPEEELFPFLLNRTIANFVTARSVVVLCWRPHNKDKLCTPKSSFARSVAYVLPPVQTHKTSAEILKKASLNDSENEAKKDHIDSGGVGLGSCLKEFCKEQKLSLSDNWRCPRCKDFREGKQDMNLWRLPDFLTFHIKRFNMSARWREKITTKVNFPLTGLDMSEWCHGTSPALRNLHPDSRIYDLIGVVNHYGSMTGGHYIATCKVSNCGKDGREEVGYSFNGVGVINVQSDELDVPSGWRLSRPKAELNQNKQAALISAKAVAESAEPTWLQFDDELVEPIPPDVVATEMAYVLFYRRRELSSSNIARYSTID
ncbi:hypothetical protein FisN_13Lh324 [Fistulifera solaris]|uniref:Uncharacterized protein n=1 Tax=Fistulifera solaris TaxID=1519565 RepID=A0A1Z5KMG2_FISSO|nr:hypothetical protein FisN_13Lh324 [Fistulifera solaris]|eukprot:GAX27128.1 hypothetical protein FisN_13Lh324 [Fistulifera solaris]